MRKQWSGLGLGLELSPQSLVVRLVIGWRLGEHRPLEAEVGRRVPLARTDLLEPTLSSHLEGGGGVAQGTRPPRRDENARMPWTVRDEIDESGPGVVENCHGLPPYCGDSYDATESGEYPDCVQ